ncbi:MAG: hypothetical protein JWM11_624 [Planctomycetaceae bacterium]|nr:hypothetical protein [Planctomycetaceae bacterium]
MSHFKTLWTWLKWPLALAILGVLIWRNQEGFRHFARQDKHWGYFGLSFVLATVSIFMTFLRWSWLVRALGFHFPLRNACRLGLMGMAVSYVGPGMVGGDSFKAVSIASGQASRRIVAAATVFLDRILGLLALMWVGALGAFISMPTHRQELHLAARWIFWISSGVGTLGLIALMIPAVTRSPLVSWVSHLPLVGRIFSQLLEGVALYQKRPTVLFFATAIAAVGHVMMCSSLYCCAQGLGGWSPGLIDHCYLTPTAEIIGLIPTPGGVGPQELAIQELYKTFPPDDVGIEVAGQAGFLASLAFRLNTMLIAAVGALFYFAAKSEVNDVQRAESTAA